MLFGLYEIPDRYWKFDQDSHETRASGREPGRFAALMALIGRVFHKTGR